MPADITTITSLITAFRTESREEAVTTEVLGALLQKIADVIATTALQTDFDSLSAWRTLFSKLSTVITSLSIGSDDRNNVYLSLNKGIVATGNVQSLPNNLVIRQATTERAGAMRAQQVQDLNKCKSDISKITSDLGTLSTALTNFSRNLSLATSATRNNTQSINSLTAWTQDTQNTINSIQLAIRNLQANFNTFASMRQTDTIHIECEIKDGKLYIQGASQLVKSGLRPVIFRYSIRSGRKWVDRETGIREYLPKRKGWHRYFHDGKIKFESDDSVWIRDDTPKPAVTKTIYSQSPKTLFLYEKVEKNDDSNIYTSIKLPYGQKLYEICDATHRFKFAIGFYKNVSAAKHFTFSDLRTNLATFKVVTRSYGMIGTYQVDYRFSR